MTIDSNQLAAFAAVLRQGSFEAAARSLHVTPSAVSQRMKQLEERIGQVLVQRTSPCIATDAGKVILKLAEQVALLEAETVRELSSVVGSERVRVPIVVNMDSLDSWFLSMTSHMPDDYLICFDIRVEDQDSSASLLREGAVMAAVTSDPHPVQGCEVLPLGVMRYLAIASSDFVRRYFPSGVNANAFGSAPMVIFNRKDSLQDRYIKQHTSEAVNPPKHCIPSAIGFVEAASRGLGWCMVPEQLARSGLDSGRLSEIAPGHFLEVPLYWQRWRLKSEALERISIAVQFAAAQSLRALSNKD